MTKKLLSRDSEAAELPRTAADFRALLEKGEVNGKDGKMSARERITSLFDEGTFTELGAYTARRVGEFDSTGTEELESVICGYGAVNGCLTYAFSQDMSRKKGSFSEAAAKKICNLYKLAVSNGAPIVGIFDSAGAYLPEGVKVLAGYGSLMSEIAKASGVIPQIAYIPGVAEGANAVTASMFDFTVALDSSKISVNPPFIVGGGKLSESEKSGLVSLTAKGESEAAAKIRSLLSIIPQNNEDAPAETESNDEINRLIGENYDDVRNMIHDFSDDGAFTELSEAYGRSVITGFASLGREVCGIVASDKNENGGRIDSAAARKAARFIGFCDCFGIPVVTLLDSEGFTECGEEEKTPLASEVAKLASVYASASTPIITLVCGAAYGSVFSVMGSKAIGADVVFATENAKISCLSAPSAVALLWNDKISGETTREQLENEWDETYANPVEAAKAGEIDDVIPVPEIRQRLASAVSMLAYKSQSAPVKRHSNMPL